MNDIIKKAKELSLELTKTVNHFFYLETYFDLKHEKDGEKSYNKITEKSEGNTLGNLRKFIEETKHLPNKCIVREWHERDFKAIVIEEHTKKSEEDLKEEINKIEKRKQDLEKYELDLLKKLRQKYEK